MENDTNNKFQLEDWLVEPKLNRISCANSTITLRPKEMAILELLASANGELVTNQEILDQVWGEVSVNLDSVYFSLSQLRKKLGDQSQTPKYIETFPKRGYRLIANMNHLHNEVSKQAIQHQTPPKLGTIHHLTNHGHNAIQSLALNYKNGLLIVLTLIIILLISITTFSICPISETLSDLDCNAVEEVREATLMPLI
jgi:DNA-binding winged helix-turn-helix (wHTH) protein